MIVQRALDLVRRIIRWLRGSTRKDGANPAVRVASVGGYRIVRELDDGSQGTVYEAIDRSGRHVALKLIRHQRNPRLRTKARGRFRREMRILSKLRHDNVCRFLASSPDAREPYLVMELCTGESLVELIATGPHLPDRVRDIALQLAAGVGHIHANSILHRDIKPGNIIMTTDGTLKIVDFGIAREPDDTILTDGRIGTPRYMSPEQDMGESVDERADVWACGIVLFELLTGKHPFKTARERLLKDPIPELRLAGVPEPWVRIVQQCIEKEPSRRFGDALALHEAVRGLTEDSAVSSRRVPGAPSDVVPLQLPDVAPRLTSFGVVYRPLFEVSDVQGQFRVDLYGLEVIDQYAVSDGDQWTWEDAEAGLADFDTRTTAEASHSQLTEEIWARGLLDVRRARQREAYLVDWTGTLLLPVAPRALLGGGLRWTSQEFVEAVRGDDLDDPMVQLPLDLSAAAETELTMWLSRNMALRFCRRVTTELDSTGLCSVLRVPARHIDAWPAGRVEQLRREEGVEILVEDADTEQMLRWLRQSRVRYFADSQSPVSAAALANGEELRARLLELVDSLTALDPR